MNMTDALTSDLFEVDQCLSAKGFWGRPVQLPALC